MIGVRRLLCFSLFFGRLIFGGTAFAGGFFPPATVSAVGGIAATNGAGTGTSLTTPTINGTLISSAPLQATNNLSDIPSAPTARTNLGLGSMSTQAAGSVTITGGTAPASILTGTLPCAVHPTLTGDVSTVAGTCTTTLATVAVAGTGLATINVKGLATGVRAILGSDLPVATTNVLGAAEAGTGISASGGALSVQYGTTGSTAAVGNDSRIAGAAQTANNLSDLASAVAARANLGLGSVATQPADAVAITGGTLGSVAITSGTVPGSILTGTVPCAAHPALTGDVTTTAGNCTTTLAAVATAGTGLATINVKGLATSVRGILPSDLPVATASTLGAAGAGAGLGVTGGALSVQYGTTSGTAAVGNDSRIAGALASVTAASTYAPIASPTFTGAVTLPSGTVIPGYLASATAASTYAPLANAALVTPNLGTPSAGNLANTTNLPCAAHPALTGDVTSVAGACTTTLATVATPGTGLPTVNVKGLSTSVRGILPSDLPIATASTLGAAGAGTGLAAAAGSLSVQYGTTGGTAAAGNDSRITGAAQAANNLSDLVNAAAARTSLGLGTVSTQAASSVAITGGTGALSSLTVAGSNVATQSAASVTVTGGTVTLTSAQLGYAVITLTGTLTSSAAVVIPTAIPGSWTFVNNSSGAYAVTLGVSGQAPPLMLTQGTTRTVSADGATLYSPISQAVGLATPTATATGDVPVFGGTTGQSLTDSGYPINNSGHALAALDGVNTWTNYQTFSGGSNIAGSTTGSMLINGDMDIDQQFEGVSNGTGIDRWYYSYTTGSALTMQRITGNSVVGYGHYLRMTAPSAAVVVNAADQRNIRQAVEGSMVGPLQWGTANAQAATLQFWAYATVPGTYAFSIANSTPNYSYVGTYTITTASTWQEFTQTIPTPGTGSSWSSFVAGQYGLMVRFDVGSGSNYATSSTGVWQSGNYETTSGVVQLIDNAAAQLSLTGVHLFIGTSIGPYIPRPYSAELTLAKRYYTKTFNEGVQPVQSAGIGGAICTRVAVAAAYPGAYFQVPSGIYSGTGSSVLVTTYNPSNTNANWRDVTAGADVTVSVDPSTAKGGTGVEIATSATVATAGDNLCIQATYDAGFH